MREEGADSATGRDDGDDSGREAVRVEEPTREVGESELGTDNNIERDEAGSEARVEEPAKDVGETGVKLSTK